MQPLAPKVAEQIGIMLELAPNALAKQMNCSKANAQRAQQLMLLAIVRNDRRYRGENTDEIDRRGAGLARKMNQSCHPVTLCLFANLLKQAENFEPVQAD